jgi:hypothetical protein
VASGALRIQEDKTLMVCVKKVDRSMFAQVYELLHEFRNEHLTRDDWQHFINYPWETQHDYCGYALVDGDRVVGFISMIFSTRVIGGKVENFCNLANWIVKDEYRGHSLSLILPSLKLSDYTLTDFTASPQVNEISQRLGFRELDSRLRLLLPLPALPARRASPGAARMVTEPDQIEPLLGPAERQILTDHRRTECHHLMVKDGDSHCYVVFSIVRTKHRLLRYSYIHYVSNRALFAAHTAAIRATIMQTARSPFLVVDHRTVADIALPLSVNLPVKTIKLYRSSTLGPAQIDNLYSELILANVNTLPGPRAMLSPYKRRFIQWWANR